jgi:hypothetical protein
MDIMKLRLFTLRDATTNKRVPDLFFPSKPEAKRERERLNLEAGANRYVVTTGPDHHRYEQH